MLNNGIGQDIGIQDDDRLDYELNPPERLIYQVDEIMSDFFACSPTGKLMGKAVGTWAIIVHYRYS